MPWPFIFQYHFSNQKSHYLFQQHLHFAKWLQSKICTELFLIPMHPSGILPFVNENSFVSCKGIFHLQTSFLKGLYCPTFCLLFQTFASSVNTQIKSTCIFLSFSSFKRPDLHEQTKSTPASKSYQGKLIP